MLKTLLLALSAIPIAYSGPFETKLSEKGEWNSANHPKIFFDQFETHLDSMPIQGIWKKVLWSDDYWPRMMGGVAFRWQTYQTPENYRLYSSRDIRRLSPQEIDELSPAEKFDLVDGDYDFPFTKRIIRQNPSDAPSWHGLCHGWAEANLHHNPPVQKTLRGKGGLEVTFRSSDIAALLSYYYGKRRRGRVQFLGRRCRGDNIQTTSCQDVNPGALHIVLVEAMKRSQGLIADIDPGSDVWNHPIKSYNYEIIQQRPASEDSAEGTVVEYHVLNKVKILTEVAPSKEPAGELLDELYFDYWLEVDGSGRVIGGSWYRRPLLDFLWYRGKRRLPSAYRRLISDT